MAPDSLEEVLELLARYGDDAKVIAGGQTLGPMLNLRMVSPSVVVDLNRIRSMSGFVEDGDALFVGALTRQAELEDAPQIKQLQPLVAQTVPLIAHRPIRNRGTVGGSLAHADPAAEWGALILALDASLTLERAGGAQRNVSATGFFQGALTTAIAPDELLTSSASSRMEQTRPWLFPGV